MNSAYYNVAFIDIFYEVNVEDKHVLSKNTDQFDETIHLFGILVKQIILLFLSALNWCRKQVYKILYLAYIIENLHIDLIVNL